MTGTSTAQVDVSTLESEYPRENWWGDYGTTGSAEADESEEAEDEKSDPNDPAEIIAFRLLSESGTPLCAATLLDDPWNGGRLAEQIAWCFEDECIDGHAYAMHYVNKAVELSDPEVRLGIKPPSDHTAGEYGTERYRRRVNEETGYLNGGETTGIIWQDRPIEEFMALVDEYLSARPYVRDCEKDEVRGLAYHMKTEGDMRDLDIMTRVVDELRVGDSN